ncbi:MAG: glycosyltransferase family 2 protein [Cycloclasticus sp.]|jgi:Glycosyltransferases, probably involved in cell wall biogenesis
MSFDLIVICIAIILATPVLVISFELLIALFYKNPVITDQKVSELRGTYTILIPAHNEAGIIGKTISCLLQQSVPPASILVVADNCTDATAEVAKGLDVTVLERVNDSQRGKGFALDYGITFLKEHQRPDVLIIFDADCEIDAGSLSVLVNSCIQNKRPTQALYLMRHHVGKSLKQSVAGFAWLVKNKIRPLAVNKLSLPVTLTGTGMAFPWHVIADVNVAHGNLVEDMQLGIDCTLNGFPPVFCEYAVVYSDFPEQIEAEKTQRTRWEHGHLMTIGQQVPRLIKQAVCRKDWRLLGLALDIGVPPVSLLVMFSTVGLFLLAGYSYVTESAGVFTLFLMIFLFFAGVLLATWWRYGREYLTIKELYGIPRYVFSKVSIYIAFIFKRQKSWVKTAREIKPNKHDE